MGVWEGPVTPVGAPHRTQHTGGCTHLCERVDQLFRVAGRTGSNASHCAPIERVRGIHITTKNLIHDTL